MFDMDFLVSSLYLSQIFLYLFWACIFPGFPSTSLYISSWPPSISLGSPCISDSSPLNLPFRISLYYPYISLRSSILEISPMTNSSGINRNNLYYFRYWRSDQYSNLICLLFFLNFDSRFRKKKNC